MDCPGGLLYSCFFFFILTFEEWPARFARYACFLERLSIPGPLSENELQTAQELQRFFDRLRKRGEMEAFGAVMGADDDE